MWPDSAPSTKVLRHPNIKKILRRLQRLRFTASEGLPLPRAERLTKCVRRARETLTDSSSAPRRRRSAASARCARLALLTCIARNHVVNAMREERLYVDRTVRAGGRTEQTHLTAPCGCSNPGVGLHLAASSPRHALVHCAPVVIDLARTACLSEQPQLVRKSGMQTLRRTSQCTLRALTRSFNKWVSLAGHTRTRSNSRAERCTYWAPRTYTSSWPCWKASKPRSHHTARARRSTRGTWQSEGLGESAQRHRMEQVSERVTP